MKKLLSLFALLLFVGLQEALAAIQVSTDVEKPEFVYTLNNANGLYANGTTGTTQTAANYGKFAFFAAANEGDYYIYSVTAKQWVTYTSAASYENKQNFVVMSATKSASARFKVNEYATGKYEIQPYTTSGTNDKYINWNGGQSKNPLDKAGITLGLWEQNGAQDAGSRWTIEKVIVIDPIDPVAVVLPDNLSTILAAHGTASYTMPSLYPLQQQAVGEAAVATDNEGSAITLYNNVLAATFLTQDNRLFFGGSKAMNLEPGTEIFKLGIGSGTEIPASGLQYKKLEIVDLQAQADAVGGSEHFAGKALVAEYEYPFGTSTLHLTWRAVLRDGSHYIRTEMELRAEGDVKMFNVIPMIYNVNANQAGSAPAVVGNTRGAVLMSDRIFAGLEHPTAYNTVGDSNGDDDKYALSTTHPDITLSASDWKDMDDALVPARIKETTGKEPSAIYAYTRDGYELKKDQKVEVTLTYTSGSHKLYIGGVDLYSSSADNIDANDYHMGYTGTTHTKNVYTFVAPRDGSYTIRVMLDGVSESIDATSKLSVKVYTAKPGAIIDTDIVPIQGLWSRNTTLPDGENWKISAVVGLVAQDGTETSADYSVNQKRRSFLAYSERERAVPWRANPVYISWYELNINRNNAAPGKEHTNFVSDQVVDVERHWLDKLYKTYGAAPKSFVIDDGWDTYGEWQFHSGFPNEMRDMSAVAQEMGAGVGAWLGPVGGYGQSGNYRRAYWNGKGGMVLGNKAYYDVFKKAATNLINNQGTLSNGEKSFQFFKFDGISAQFSSTGPDAGDAGNENAEGIIRLERFVREELKRDIFFNTTVGTWASPFWYHYTDATWRQENDYGTIGNNAIDREKWITYRDRLVYQNYVQNSPICPINTLMTHGFILSNFGAVSKDMSYDACLRELRCAFACGSGMVELYNDYSLMNSIADNEGNQGALWKDLANLIEWQKANADVLPDAHWVGGNPWNGTETEIYGWGAYNGGKAVLTLRNGNDKSASKQFKTTLRKALNIPAGITGTVKLQKCWSDQPVLKGWPESEDIDIDTELTLTLPKNTLYMFSTTTIEEKRVYIDPNAPVRVKNLSELDNNKVYNIVCQRGFLLYNDAAPTQICSNNGKSFTAPAQSSTDVNQQFKIISENGKYYLYNCGAQKYVGANGMFTNNKTQAVTITATGNVVYPWMFSVAGNYFNMQAAGQNNEGIVINSYSTKDAGNQYYIVEAIAEDGPTGINTAPSVVAPWTNSGKYVKGNRVVIVKDNKQYELNGTATAN
ncbi:MAG: hypothetical protein KBT12_01915 [Bacteroidales bacterium]|nr:hypothetical protein [Candidatus Physcousia equi]